MIYVVNPGDSVFSIAAAFGLSPEQILYENQLYGQQHLVVGQALLLSVPAKPQELLPAMEVSGYAYPFIDMGILGESIRTIQKLLVFSYGYTTEGELVPPMVDDLPLVITAWENGVRPILVLTPFGPDGRFNNYLVNVLVENPQIQEQLIENLLFTVEDRGYAGVDVDFEYILPQDREAYAQFVGSLRERMNALGYEVSVALAPKVSADQPGLLYEGMDYRLLGENADSVFLMTYEWGYTYGPPMAVAPLNQVRRVVEYAVLEIPVEKIIMGIPNYAYDWTLPYERGVTAARLISNVEAVRIAAENNAQILFDQTAASPHFSYQREGLDHEVWFEDVRSIDAKLRLAAEFGLAGVGYWNLMRPFRANWLLLDRLLPES
ncbi:MAG: glycosyl hydrolase family 18 protein [Blautia sp.]